MDPVEIRIAPGVERLGVYVLYLEVRGVSVERGRTDVAEHGRRLVEQVRSTYTLEALRLNPVIRAYRDFMWRLGIDPTKIRPSSDALVRRILRSGVFPHINNVVDSGNLASVETLVSLGLYDEERIAGNLELRFARGGEIFNPIGKRSERLSGSEIVLVDDEGRVLHVYPYRDSRETMIRDSTRSVLVVGAGVPGIPRSLVAEAVEKTARYLEAYAGASFTGDLREARRP